MRKIPTQCVLHPALWGPANVPWENADGSTKPWAVPGYGTPLVRSRGPTLNQPRRLRDDRADNAWYWGSNSYSLEFLPPPRLPTVDIVTLDVGTARAFATSPQSDTYPGTGGTHITGQADRDLLLIMPSSAPRTAAIHVWGYRGVYLLGGRLKPLPTGSVTTTAAVNATTVWNGLAQPMIRVIPHPDAVAPFFFMAGVRIENNPALHGSSGGIAFGNIISFGSFSSNPANLPDIYMQGMLSEFIPGWTNSLNVGSSSLSRSSIMGFGEGGINRAYFANLDIAISHWGRITTSPNARPTALGSPTGKGKLLLRNCQYRPFRASSLYPQNQQTVLYTAANVADINAGNYHETTLENVWTTPHPGGRGSDLSLATPTTAPATVIDRGDYLEWTPFIGAGREAPPITGVLNIGEAPIPCAPEHLMGISRIVDSLAYLDALIAGA